MCSTTKEQIFEKSYMPFAIKWGRFSCVIAMLMVYFPALALAIFFWSAPGCGSGDHRHRGNPIRLQRLVFCGPHYPVPYIGPPGMYMTYVSGNSKEIRGPAALQAMDAAEVDAGTPEGTVISAIGIATSTLISLTVMTIVAVAGNFLLQVLPAPVVTSLKYLLPSLFGALAMQRVVLNPKVASVGVPLAFITFFLKKMGVFTCMFLSKAMFLKEHPECKK